MRLFVAVAVPDPVRVRLEEAQDSLRRSAPGAVRWVRPEAIHLTLKFLGEVEEERLSGVLEALEGVSCEPFQVEVAGIGFFPGGARVRVVWAGCEEPSGRLRALQESVEAALERAGFEREARDFHPHLTLGRARDRRGVRGLREEADPLRHVEFGRFVVNTFELMESRLLPTGAQYEVAGSWALGATEGEA